MKPIKIDNVTPQREDKITLMDIYRTLWSCRDFELSHLWQRSVFLTAFLLLVYTGYGILIFNLLTVSKDVPETTLLVLSCLGLFILLIGIVLSQLWIMMAKGSKAWYEVYEKAIMEIEGNSRYATETVTDFMSDDEVRHGYVPNPDNFDYRLNTTHAGGFSPSRINIIIGQLSFAVLLILYVVHTCLMAYACGQQDWPWSLIILLSSTAALLIVCCFSCHYLKDRVKSSAIRK